MNQIRHVTVLVALPLRAGCDGGGGGSTEDPSRAYVCVGRGMRAVREDRAGQGAETGAGGGTDYLTPE